jgi:hypothetical protein
LPGLLLAGLAGLAILGILLPAAAVSQRPEPEVHGVFYGDTLHTVLPPGAIPAIMVPEFVSGKAADAQMLPDEKVLGIIVDGRSRAYSLWHLDAHEIVNDSIAGLPIAPTW